MRIALTGTSSTGKTTLLEDLMNTDYFIENRYTVAQIDSRSILTDMGLRADSKGCDPKAMRKFQWRILEEKQANEANATHFITDRSYLDLAAYWLSRSETHDEETSLYLKTCLNAASKYTTHIFLPFGRIPFTPDGYRPSDPQMLQNVSNSILSQIKKHYFKHLVLETNDRGVSTNTVLEHIKSI